MERPAPVPVKSDQQQSRNRFTPRTDKLDKRTIKGPYSALIDRGALGTINGRSREGKFLRAYEKMLVEHVGGQPSVTQRALISRTARLALHLELLDEKAIKKDGGLTPTDCHFYAVW